MDKLILDTDILIDHIHGHAVWVDELLEKRTIQLIVPTIVVAEYHTAQELETKEGKEVSTRYLETFKIYDFTYPMAEILGTMLRKKTYPTGASIADLMIAATALYLKSPLATRNTTHFHGIPDLILFKHWK